MIETFEEALALLAKTLSLKIENTSLRIIKILLNEQEIHITEFPRHHLLMLNHILHHNITINGALFQNNFFSQEPLQPIISQDEATNDWVIWNRQPFSACNYTTLLQQLKLIEALSQNLLINHSDSFITDRCHIGYNAY